MVKKKKKRIGFFTKLAIVVFTVYAAITLINLQVQINSQKKESVQLTEQLNEANAKNLALQEAISSELSDEMIAALAREKLDLAAPGERVFIDTSN